MTQSTGRREFLQTAAGAIPASLGLQGADRRPPNILFLFPDQLRGDWVEPAPGIPVRTPNVKRLAAEGVQFSCAVTPSPLCAPARGCLASGKEYDHCRVPDNGANYPLDQPTLYQFLQKAGYHVMGCGKFDLHKPELDWGVDGKRKIAAWGFSDGIDNEGKHDGVRAYVQNGRPMGPFLAYLDQLGVAALHVEDYEKRKSPAAAFPTPLSDEAYGDNWIARNGLRLLDRAPRRKPWFLQVNFNGPHSPWDITTSMEKGWRGVRFPQPNRCQQFTPAEHEAIRQNYAAMIENIDRWVGRYLDKLRERGELDNTLVVFSSDHGEMLGDHTLWGKTKPYQASAGVPLVVRGPGVRKGVTDPAPATTLDLTATFLDYAGAQPLPGADSRSLRALLEGRKTSQRSYVRSGLGDWRLVIEGRYKYVRGFGPEPLLFDRTDDPFENENRAADKPEVAKRLSALLDSHDSGSRASGF